jgi:myo-inositol-1(or 4)-monophosphatase
MKRLYNELCDIVRRAGEIILSAHDVDNADIVSMKAGDSANLVTVYDAETQGFIINEILSLVPEAVFIAEEKDNDSEMLKAEYCFIIDPIDGTSNFGHDYRHSCISLALFSHGVARYAIVYDPYLNEMFTAEQGGGAYLNGNRISVSEREPGVAMVAFGTAPYQKSRFSRVTFALGEELFRSCRDIRRSGTAALDLAYLAAGRNDIFFEFSLSPWDFAAGGLIITEAGGIITDADGKIHDYKAPAPVFAANKKCYRFLIDTVKKIKA